MAANTAPWGWSGSNYHELARFEVVLVRQDDLNNRSLFRVIIGNNSNNSYGETGSLSYVVKDQNATRYSGSRGNTPTTGYHQNREYARYEFWINHNNDGTLSNRVFTLVMSRSLGEIRSVSIVVNINNIPTIPRESKITALNNITLPGGTPTFAIEAHSTSYRHAADLKIDGVTIATMNGLAAGTHSFALTQTQIANILNRIPNDVKRTYQVVISTYSSGSRIGKLSSRNATINVANSVVPAINDILVSNFVEDAAFDGPFIQNKTQLGINVDCVGVYSSRITSIRIKFQGIIYNTHVEKTPIITSSGLLPIEVEITDSRGRKSIKTENVAFLPYQRPSIREHWGARAVREMIGKPPSPDRPIDDPDGTWLRYGMDIDVSPIYLNGNSNPYNTSQYKVEFRERTSTFWTEIDAYNDFQYWFNKPQWGTSLSETEILDPNISYEVRFVLEDMFERLERVISIPTAFTVIDFHSDGKNLAIGKVSEARGMEVNIPIYAYQEMKQNDGARVVDEHNMHELTSKGICRAGVGFGNSNNFTMKIDTLYHNEPIPMDYIPLNSGDTFTKEGIYFRVNRDCIIEVVANIYTAGSSNSTTTGGINKITNGSTTRIAGFVATTPTTGYQYNSCTAVFEAKEGDLLFSFLQAQKAGQTINVRWETTMIIKQI